MAVTRPLKEGSVTTYQQKVALGFPDILASEMDADLDTIYAAWNGGVATTNIIDGSVTTAKLALAPNGVATGNLNDLAVTVAKLARGASTFVRAGNQAIPYRNLTATSTVLIEATPTMDVNRPVLVIAYVQLLVNHTTAVGNTVHPVVTLFVGGTGVTDGTQLVSYNPTYVLQPLNHATTVFVPVVSPLPPVTAGPQRIKLVGSTDNITDYTTAVSGQFDIWQFA